MKRSLFEKLIYHTPQWVLGTVIYGVGGLILFALLFIQLRSYPEPIPLINILEFIHSTLKTVMVHFFLKTLCRILVAPST